MGKRRHFTGQEKVAILRRHFVEQVAVSDLCEEYDLQPSLFYWWQQQLFEQGAQVFEHGSERADKQAASRITQLEAKLRQRHEVLSELLEEHLQLKKKLGER